jgi:hypothetical protein
VVVDRDATTNAPAAPAPAPAPAPPPPPAPAPAPDGGGGGGQDNLGNDVPVNQPINIPAVNLNPADLKKAKEKKKQKLERLRRTRTKQLGETHRDVYAISDEIDLLDAEIMSLNNV